MTSGVNRNSRQTADEAREPLVEINPETPSAGAPAPQTFGRRRKLSDVQNQTADPQPPSQEEPSPAGSCNRRKCASEITLQATGPGLVDLQSTTATLEPPDDIGEIEQEDFVLESASTSQAPQTPGRASSRPSLLKAAGGGSLAAVVGALVWAVTGAVTGTPVTWMAVGVGLLIAGAVRVLSHSSDRSSGCLAAGLSLFACLLGNCLANGALIAHDIGLSAASVLLQISPSALPKLIVATFHPLDLLFYALATYLGYRYAFPRRATSN